MSRSQKKFVEVVARDKGLTIVGPEALTVRRQRCGMGFCFRLESGALLRDRHGIARLKALAVPPAYTEVRYAEKSSAHLQAVGTDAAGRLQYRYHPKSNEVREALKARRLVGLAKALPDIERAVAKALQFKAKGGKAVRRRCAMPGCALRYVHEAVVAAFEQGALRRLRKPTRSPIRKAEVLARIVARHGS